MIRRRIELGFEAWGRFVVRWRWGVLAGVVAFSLGMGSLLPQLRVDNSSDAFLHEDDTERERYDRFREQYGEQNRVVILIEPPALFDAAFLERLRAFHRAIEEEIPYLEEVESLVNARSTRGEGNKLVVEDLLEHRPSSDAELAALRERIRTNPLHLGLLVSEDLNLTLVTVRPYTYSTLEVEDDGLGGFADTQGRAEYLTQEERYAFVQAIYALTDRFDAEDFRLYVAGGAIIDYELTEIMQRDMATFLPLAITVNGLLLLILFRRVSGLVLPVLVVLSSMLSTFGVMALLDIPFSITLNILPAFLMVVGLSDSVHLLVILFQRMATGMARREALVAALGHSGLAVVMTSVTTAAGLASFMTAELAPVAQLGVIAPIGVMLAMLYSLSLLPALVAILPLSEGGRRGDPRDGLPSRILVEIGDFVTLRPVVVLTSVGLLLAVSSIGLMRVRFSHDGLRWFPADDPMRAASELIDDRLQGTSGLELIVHTGRENGLHEPETMERIEAATSYVKTLAVDGRGIEKTVSLLDVLRETHQALNENRREFYTIPKERRVIAQELLLFENSGSDDLSELTDSQFESARVTIRMPWVDAMVFRPFLEELRLGLSKILGNNLEYELTGGVVIFTKVFSGVIISMTRSYVFALLVITPMLVLLVGDLRRGLAATIPNLVPIYLTLCIMGWFDIPLDASTLLIGGVLLGLAVDDTIHFMHKYNTYYDQDGDARSAVRETLATTGNALLFTTLILSCGFSVFLASYLNTTFWFGALMAVAAAVAFAADVIIAPALMVLLSRGDAKRAAQYASK